MLVLGITGSVGSGKSTVARLLAKRGAARLDADAIAHALITRGKPAWREIVRTFGRGLLDARGHIDRARLAQRVFAHPRARRQLERIVHPRVLRAIRRQLRIWRQGGRVRIAAVEIPLLFEARAQDLVDYVVVVTTPRAVQEARLRHQGWSSRKIRERIAAQWQLSDKVALADVVIDNGSRVADTRRQVKDVWNRLLPLSKASSTSQR
jgi:dephospho-CoA kinase